MDDRDKMILAMRAEGRKEVHKSIYDEYTIIGAGRFTFDWCSIVHGRIHMMLPMEFVDLPLEIAKLRYPSESRPKEIKSSMDSLTNVAFLYGQKVRQEKEVVYAARIFAATIHQLNPGNDFKKSGTFYRMKKDGRLVSWYEFFSPAYGGMVYNCHAFLSVEGKLLQVVFNCPEDNGADWKEVLMEMLASVYSDLEKQFEQKI